MTNTINTKVTVADLKNVYAEKGWNGLHAFLRKNKVIFELTVHHFGLHTSKKAIIAKNEWLETPGDNEFRAHLYSLGVKSKGYCYNRVRGQQVTLK